MRELRKDMQIIFQDPMLLNPRMTVGDIIGEPLRITDCHRAGEGQTGKELLEVVGLSSYHARRYPHEFSGGQRQRIELPGRWPVNPKLIICDGRSRHWTSLFRRRLLTYSKIYRRSTDSLIYSLPMT